jgi:predicted RNA-binding Zn-ribbon protein involved in translation (DUF1610 family)
MEERVKVESYIIKFKCPECDTGYQVATGQILTTFRSFHEHKCDNTECGHRMTFEGNKYPQMDYTENK